MNKSLVKYRSNQCSFTKLENKKNITSSLNKIKKCITNDFARKPRAIEEFKRYKATEFRQFLLYTGPVVLKNILPDDCYQHFMVFSVSLRILLSSKTNS